MEYRPLDFATFEFRLLSITLLAEHEALGSMIQCSLYHRDLIDPPNYRALSYCWGDPTITKSIMIDGHVVQVTTNLEAALQQLRALDISIVWVDALCINQADLTERGLQVMRMDRIFSKASGVIAWLGLEENDSELALSLLDGRFGSQRPYWSMRIIPNTQPDSFQSDNSSLSSTSSSISSSYISSIRTGLVPPPPHEHRTPAAESSALFNRPFWRRVWIIQEVAKARYLHILIGGKLIPWWMFEGALKKTMRELPLEFRALQNFRSEEQRHRPRNLIDALQRSKNFESTDVRDKIYALLGLAIDGLSIVPTPNYVQSPGMVYFQVIEQFVQKSSSLSWLVRKRPRGGNPGDTAEPDWTNLKDGIPGRIFSILSRETRLSPWASVYEQVIYSSTGRKDRVFFRWLPVSSRTFQTHLSYYGLVTSVEILGKIDFITMPFEIPQTSCLKQIDHIGESRSPEKSKWKLIHVTKQKNSEILMQSTCSAVLFDFWEALTSDLPRPSFRYKGLQTELQIAYSFADFCIQSKWILFDHPETIEEHFSNWIVGHQTFVYCGKTLRDWVETYADTAAYKNKYAKIGVSRRRVIMRRILMRISPVFGFKSSGILQKDLLNAVSKASQKDLRLALVNKSSTLGYVGSNVREGDLICLLRGATVPIVVRPESGGYSFICETEFSPFHLYSQPDQRWAARLEDHHGSTIANKQRIKSRRRNSEDSSSTLRSVQYVPRSVQDYDGFSSTSSIQRTQSRSRNSDDGIRTARFHESRWESITIR